MMADRPIETAKQDYFGYTNYARLIAKKITLIREDNLVIGVESQWGSGKTSFLNLVRHHLERELQGNFILVDYNPWIYSNLQSLLIGFFGQIAAQLNRPLSDGASMQKVATALEMLSQLLSMARFIPAIQLAAEFTNPLKEGAAALIKANEFEKLDVSGAKKKVETAIAETGSRLAVFIDDIDRLPPDEIRLLFQFLKSVADFKSVTYILAYDPDPVTKALSFNDRIDGGEYLKKFVSVPIRLPRLSAAQLTTFLVENLKKTRVEGSGKFKEELRAICDTAGEIVRHPAIKTPRDVIRLLNSFNIKWSDLRGEVDAVTIVKYVALEYFCPTVVDLVRAKPSVFLSHVARFHMAFLQSEENPFFEDKLEERRAAMQSLLAEHFPNEHKMLLPLCVDLFKPFGEVGSNVRGGAHPEAIVKLIYGAGSVFAFSFQEAKAFLRTGKLSLSLKMMFNAGRFDDWIYFLTGVISDASIPDPLGTALRLIRMAADFDKFKNRAASQSSLSTVAGLLPLFLTRIDDHCSKVEFLEKLVRDSPSLFTSEILLIHLSRDVGIWRGGKSYPADQALQDAPKAYGLTSGQVRELQLEWLGKVVAAAHSGDLIKDPFIVSILHRWGQFSNNDYSAVQEFIKTVAEQQDIAFLFAHFTIETGLDGLWKLLPPSLEKVRESVARGGVSESERDRIAKLLCSVEKHRAAKKGGEQAEGHPEVTKE